MPDIPAGPFREALKRSQEQRERARAVGDQLRAEDAQRAAEGAGEGDVK